MYSVWSTIPFSFSYEIPCPCWFPLVGVLLKDCIYWFLWFCHVVIFMVLWNCFSNFHISVSHLFRFLDLLNGCPPGFEVYRVFIKGYISTDVDLLESWEVSLVGLWCIIVSYEYTLPPRRINLGPLLLWDMYVQWATKYSKMAEFCVLFWERLFWSFLVKYSMRSTVLYIHSFPCFFCPKVHKKILVM